MGTSWRRSCCQQRSDTFVGLCRMSTDIAGIVEERCGAFLVAKRRVILLSMIVRCRIITDIQADSTEVMEVSQHARKQAVRIATMEHDHVEDRNIQSTK